MNVAPKSLHRVLQAQGGAAGREKYGIHSLDQELGRERMCQAIPHPQFHVDRLVAFDDIKRVEYVAVDISSAASISAVARQRASGWW